MTNAQHTLGPWIAHYDHDGRHHDIPIMSLTGCKDDNGPGKVASVWRGKGHHFDQNTCEANARLIAAAPELLEVAEMVLHLRKLGHPISDSLVEPARAAIAKATSKASESEAA